MSARPTLTQLFLLFLRIGATSFGGNVALVAAIREHVVLRRKWLEDDMLLDGTTVASVLPGPLATNVTTFIGYRLRGFAGGLVCLGAVLLPSFILLCSLSWLYFRYGQLSVVEAIFHGILPGVAAVILAAAIDLAKKNVKRWEQWLIVAAATFLMAYVGGIWITLLVMFGAGVIGYFLFKKDSSGKINSSGAEKNFTTQETSTKALLREFLPYAFTVVLLIGGLLLALNFSVGSLHEALGRVALLGGTFGGMSLTLFGGGYVFVPAIEQVVVHTHHWLSGEEFAHGIAMGQVTPGPIMISAAFIGWKVNGFWGALVSTVAIFLPPACVTVFASHFVERIRRNPAVDAIFKGMRPAVVGLIFAAVLYFLRTLAPGWPSIFRGEFDPDWPVILIFAGVLGLALFVKKIDPALLIPISGLLGWLFYLA